VDRSALFAVPGGLSQIAVVPFASVCSMAERLVGLSDLKQAMACHRFV